jgi:hypothetical protein
MLFKIICGHFILPPLPRLGIRKMADNLTKFLDIAVPADPIYPYEPSLAANKTPIIIDNGLQSSLIA